MPNHVVNRLTVIGPHEQVSKFVSLSTVPRPKTGDEEGSPNFCDDLTPRQVTFDFYGVVPLPARYSEVPYSRSGALMDSDNGYSMEVDTWGVKWGPYRIKDGWRLEIGKATIEFTTAWEPPRVYYSKASALFPDVTFIVSYGGEGPCFGRLVYFRGRCVLHEEGHHSECPEYADYGDEREDEYFEADAAVVYRYARSHEAFVSQLSATETTHVD